MVSGLEPKIIVPATYYPRLYRLQPAICTQGLIIIFKLRIFVGLKVWGGVADTCFVVSQALDRSTS